MGGEVGLGAENGKDAATFLVMSMTIIHQMCIDYIIHAPNTERDMNLNHTTLALCCIKMSILFNFYEF